MSLLFVFAFALNGVLYPSKDITLTHNKDNIFAHKQGGVKTLARKFFDQKHFDARGKDKTP